MFASITPFKHTPQTPDRTALQALRGALTGELYTPADVGYDGARTPWDLHVEQRPAAVVMAAGPADIVAAVRFARARGLTIAIQATGHGAVIPCDGGLLINTSRMQGLRIDPVARSAWLEAGVKWQPVLDEAQKYGLTPLLGSTPDVGAVGYSLGGGLGWLGRKYGLAVDSVRAFDIVTADGQLRHVTESSDPELFWGVRGGGGNFGVITALEVELFPVAEVYGGNLYFPIAKAREVLLAYREWIKTLSDDWTTAIALMHIPPLPFLPEPLQGQSVCIVRGCYVGDMVAGQAGLQPMRDLGGLIFDAFGPMSFSDVATISNDPLDPTNAQGFTEVLTDLSPEAIETMIAVTGRASESPIVFAEVRHVGGSVNSVPAESSAFGHRDMEFILFVLAVVMNPAEEHPVAEYMRQAHALFEPHRTGQIYLNFLHDTDMTVARVRASFTPQTYARLVAIKDHYDPANMFRFNRNIPPSRTPGQI